MGGRSKKREREIYVYVCVYESEGGGEERRRGLGTGLRLCCDCVGYNDDLTAAACCPSFHVADDDNDFSPSFRLDDQYCLVE